MNARVRVVWRWARSCAGDVDGCVRHACLVEARHEGRRGRLRAVAVAVAGVALALAGVAGAVAATSKHVIIADATGDVSGVLDLQRVSLSLAPDGRLRAIVTFAGTIEPKSLLAGTGPPGSVCVKVWTSPDADPAAMRPDRLVCATALNDHELRANVLKQIGTGLPKPVGSAAVRVNRSGRSLVLRISQSSLGRPALLRFAVESTRPGCARVSCIDDAPDKGAVRRFRVRRSA
jgi:hypothetical protein